MTENLPSAEVTALLDRAPYPLRDGIEALRQAVLSSDYELSENIKWNGPNYSHLGADRITIRTQPPTRIQVIFHRGAKVLEKPKERLLSGEYDFLVWKVNDRAVATFVDANDVARNIDAFRELVNRWIDATLD